MAVGLELFQPSGDVTEILDQALGHGLLRGMAKITRVACNGCLPVLRRKPPACAALGASERSGDDVRVAAIGAIAVLVI